MMTQLERMQQRGFVALSTDEDKLDTALSNRPVVYLGFDPTAPSLTAGHLVPLAAAKWLMIECKAKVMFLIGESVTAKIGDPTGKVASRPIMDSRTIHNNAFSLRWQLINLFPRDVNPIQLDPHCSFVDNAVPEGSTIDVVCDLFSHFRVNEMLRKDTFAKRLESGEGLSLMEFVYPCFQAHDFLALFREHGCTVQLAGQDQWTNCLAGVELIAKMEGADASVLCTPLVISKNGEKMGKSADGTVWLDPKRTSPFDFFQYWRNIDDSLVRQMLLLLTDTPVEDIDAIADPNEAKEMLAFSVTKWVHGEDAAMEMLLVAKDIFTEGATNTEGLEEVVIAGDTVAEMLHLSGLAPSKAKAKELIRDGAVKVDSIAVEVGALTSDLVNGSMLSVGKKRHFKLVGEQQ